MSYKKNLIFRENVKAILQDKFNQYSKTITQGLLDMIKKYIDKTIRLLLYQCSNLDAQNLANSTYNFIPPFNKIFYEKGCELVYKYKTHNYTGRLNNVIITDITTDLNYNNVSKDCILYLKGIAEYIILGLLNIALIECNKDNNKQLLARHLESAIEKNKSIRNFQNWLFENNTIPIPMEL